MSQAVVEQPETTLTTEEKSGAWVAEPPRAMDEAGLPGWYAKMQSEAWEEFLATPVPSRTDESWRFANLKGLKFEGFRLAEPVDGSYAASLRDESGTQGLEGAAARLVFANNRLIDRDVARLPEGVICLPLAEALASHGDLLQALFLQEEVRLGGGKFAALHRAASLSGVFVFVPNGVEITGAIEVFHWAGGNQSAIFPHTLVVAEENAKVSVIDRFRSADNESILAVGMNDLVAGRGSHLRYVAIQEWNSSSRHIQINTTRVEQDGDARSCFVNLGSAWVRNESVSRMAGPGANSNMLSIGLVSGDQEIDQRTLQLHEAQHTTSDLLYKNALYERARTIFAGLIKVDEKANHTDAYQKCRNLLSSDEAEANAMPGLEINADQVKCSHGATSGQISDEEIFYLRARGIDQAAARKMITLGFLEEVLERLEVEGLRELVDVKLEAKFQTL